MGEEKIGRGNRQKHDSWGISMENQNESSGRGCGGNVRREGWVSQGGTRGGMGTQNPPV